ncbi:MAG TPA: hypothetical protein VG013_22450 [Gemmataceae bacterium]|jgi:hypothetical protein|nr:hypothetical protein [Gemmataceae bacterium]
MADEHEDISGLTDDPVARLLLTGRAETLREAEELYLDSCFHEVVRLLQGPLSDEELGRHPLMRMLRAHGSRGWEETVE